MSIELEGKETFTFYKAGAGSRRERLVVVTGTRSSLDFQPRF